MNHNSGDRAVSPAIGAVLAVVLTVSLVGVLGITLIDFSSELNEPGPNLAVEFSVTQLDQNVRVTHQAGATLDTDRMELRGPGTLIFSGDQLAAGDSFVIRTERPSEEFRLLYADSDASATLLTTIANPLLADLGGVPPQITVGYEDLTLSGGNDYDYNDWVFDMQTTVAGYKLDGTRYATALSIEFDPSARGGGYKHDQHIVPEGLGTGEYELTVSAANGTVVRQEAGEFDANTSIFLVNSGDVFDAQTNSDSGASCTAPERTMQLELTLDESTAIPDNPIDADRQHGAGLPFNLTMEPSGNNNIIGIGDPRLVTVPTDWRWPTERTHIADAYEAVGPDDAGNGDDPEFEENTWFEEPADTNNVFDGCG